MKVDRRRSLSGNAVRTFTGLLLIVLSVAASPRAEHASVLQGPPYVCLPTCAETDGRFFVVPGGSGTDTFSRTEMVLKIDVSSSVPLLELAIFDGETGASDGGGKKHWDQGTLEMTYEVYTDPDGDGLGNALIHSVPGATMPDNAWFTLGGSGLPHDAGALDGATYRYVLRIVNQDTSPLTWSAFKVRTPLPNMLRVGPQIFSLLAPITNLDDAQVLYPSYPTLSPTTYDGEWEMFVEVALGQKFLTVWNGDLDFGALDCSTTDTDDPDTPNAVPAFAVGTNAVPESIAVGGGSCASNQTPTGNPADDDTTPGSVYRRPASITLQLIDPNNQIFTDHDPSGNKEWEQFTIGSGPACDRTGADYCVPSLPAGTWRMKVLGMDLGNVNSFFVPADATTPQRRVRIQKVTGSATHPAEMFIGTLAPGGPDTAFSVVLATDQPVGSFQDRQVSHGAHTVAEAALPSGWTLIGYAVKPDNAGTESCRVGETYLNAPAAIPADANNYLVCIRNDFGLGTREVRIQKITMAPAPSSTVFSGPISPGGPNTGAWAVQVNAGETLSDVAVRTLSSAHQTVDEAVPDGWTLRGFAVKPDPAGTETCSPSDTYSGSQGIVPANGNQYLVCVRNEVGVTTRTVRVQKVTSAPVHVATTFSGAATPPSTSLNLTLPQNQQLSNVLTLGMDTNAPGTVTETLVPAGWVLTGYTVKPDPGGDAICTIGESYTAGPATIPADSTNYLVCIRNELSEQNRIIRIQKITSSVSHSQTTFVGDISPGGPDVNWGVVLPQDAQLSNDQQRDVSSAAHTIVETPVPADWTITGYLVKPDPSGVATCSLADTYSTAPGANVVPADSNRYLVCVRNHFGVSRQVRIIKTTLAATHSGGTFSGTISPGSPFSTTFTVALSANTQVSPATLRLASHNIAHTVAETEPSSRFALGGYVVKADPAGTATCSPGESYSTAPGANVVPADTNNYVVCIRNDATRTIRIIKTTATSTHPGATFTGTISPGSPDTTFTVTLAPDAQVSAPALRAVNQNVGHAVTETNTPGFNLVGYIVKPDSGLAATCSPTETYTGANIVPADAINYTVCIRGDLSLTRTVRIQKLTVGPPDFAMVFRGSIQPGGPNTGGWAVQVPGGATASDVAVRELSKAAQTISEIPPSGWTVRGFTVKPDPDGTAACSPTETYTGTQASLPADSAAYLVCVKNEFTATTRVVRVQKLTATTRHAETYFTGSVSTAGAFSLSVRENQARSAALAFNVPINMATTVVESPVPAGWTLIGYTVKLDPDLKASCLTTETYLGTANVPANTSNYLVCIRNEAATRTVRIIKTTASETHPGGQFTGSIFPGFPERRFDVSLAPNAQVSSPAISTVQQDVEQVIAERAQTSVVRFNLVGYIVKPDPALTAECSPTETYTGGPFSRVPADASNYTLCIRSDVAPTRTVRIQKITAAPVGSATVFWGPIQPGGPITGAWAVQVPAGQTESDVATRDLTNVDQSISETPVSGWTLVGFTDKADPTGNATCSPNETYSGAQVVVQKDTGNRLVCVKNEFSSTSRIVRVITITGSNTHPAQEFTGTVTPPGLGFNLMLAASQSASAAQSFAVPFTTSSSVVESPVPAGWTLVGYSVEEDPDGTATCNVGAIYTGSATVPADTNRYLVCIRNDVPAPYRLIRVQHVTQATTHPTTTFEGVISPGGPDINYGVVIAQNQQFSDSQTRTVTQGNQQEVAPNPSPAGWTTFGYVVKPDPDGVAACSLSDSYSVTPGSNAVPADSNRYLVCIRSELSEVSRVIRVQKITSSASHAQTSFVGNISPGGTDVNWGVVLPSNAQLSNDQARTVSSATQTIVETPVPAGWTLTGYLVKPDPFGTETCSLGDLYSTVPGANVVQADNSNYLLCIRNDRVP